MYFFKKNFEENLLKIYSEKLHQQVESERKQLDEVCLFFQMN